MLQKNLRKNTKKMKLLESSTAWIIEENLPLNTTQKKSFQRMIKTIDPNCEALSRQNITDEVKNLGRLCVKAIKLELTERFFSLTTDHWTSKNNENYSCLTAHWIDNNSGLLQSAVLTFVVHDGSTTGENIANQFVHDLQSYGFDLNYVFAIVTDTIGI